MQHGPAGGIEEIARISFCLRNAAGLVAYRTSVKQVLACRKRWAQLEHLRMVVQSVEFEFIKGKTMRNNADIQNTEEKLACEGSWRRLCQDIVGGHSFGRGLYFVQTIVGYAFGVYAGLAVGGLLGGYIGSVHAQDIQYAVDFLDFNQLRQWLNIPWAFARIGVAVGVPVGLIAMRITEIIFLNKTIVSLCKKEPAEPEEIADILGRGVRQVRRRMNRLARKGMITYPVTDSSEEISSGVLERKHSLCNLAAPAPALARI